MDWLQTVWVKIRPLLRRKRVEDELSDELRFHLERQAEENLRAGLPAEEARDAALRKLGRLEQIKEECRDTRRTAYIESLFQDLRYGLRMLRRNPGFSSVAVLSLTLGIGVNSLVFSVMSALLSRPLPVARPDQLVFLETKDSGITQSFPNYQDLRDRNTTFAGLVGYRLAPMELESTSGATRIWGLLATGNSFDMLGVHPLLGRFFHQAEDLHPGASPYAVLSYRAWRSRFDSDPR